MTEAVIAGNTNPGPSIDESYENLVKEGLIQDDTTQTGEEEAPKGEPKDDGLILGKFKTQDDLVKAYQELQKKMGEGAKAEPTTEGTDDKAAEEASEAVEKAGLDMGALEAEFAEKGELSPESLAALEKAGITKAQVDAYIEGQAAQAELYEMRVISEVGKREEYDALIKWASTNLTDAEIDEFDQAVNSFDLKKASFAVRNLKARMEVSAGREPASKLNGSQSSQGVMPYESTAQMLDDMNHPKYDRDPAFRRQVEARIAVTPDRVR